MRVRPLQGPTVMLDSKGRLFDFFSFCIAMRCMRIKVSSDCQCIECNEQLYQLKFFLDSGRFCLPLTTFDSANSSNKTDSSLLIFQGQFFKHIAGRGPGGSFQSARLGVQFPNGYFIEVKSLGTFGQPSQVPFWLSCRVKNCTLKWKPTLASGRKIKEGNFMIWTS